MIKLELNKIYNDDCMNVMRKLEDKSIDLAIVDPPYGIGKNWKKNKHAKFKKHENEFNNTRPGKEYFEELFRVSKNQIIWGCNYFWDFLKPSNNLIFWDKQVDTFTQFGSAGELAWTSITRYPFLKVALRWNGCVKCEKVNTIHPHQKPIALYSWLLNIFANENDIILDTHSGSGSCAVACHLSGFDFIAVERDEDYYESSITRLNEELEQGKIFY